MDGAEVAKAAMADCRDWASAGSWELQSVICSPVGTLARRLALLLPEWEEEVDADDEERPWLLEERLQATMPTPADSGAARGSAHVRIKPNA